MPTISFVHANGFPADSYKKIFSNLHPDIKVIAKNKYGHDPKHPVTNNWPHLINELTQFVESQSDEPVIAVGHSFGAVLSYLAVCKRPQLFSGLIMLDPPIVFGPMSYLAKAVKRLPIIDRLTPARTAVRRRRHWSQETNVIDSFNRRSFFKTFDKDCLKDYVDAIAVHRNGRIELDFCADVEAEIFRTVPDNLNRLAGKLSVPSYVITGELTDVSIDRFIVPFSNRNGITHLKFQQGQHMFPLEKPLETAALLNELITQIN